MSSWSWVTWSDMVHFQSIYLFEDWFLQQIQNLQSNPVVRWCDNTYSIVWASGQWPGPGHQKAMHVSVSGSSLISSTNCQMAVEGQKVNNNQTTLSLTLYPFQVPPPPMVLCVISHEEDRCTLMIHDERVWACGEQCNRVQILIQQIKTEK